MSDEKNENAGKKFVWRWKDALIYGAVWISAAAVIQLGVVGSVYIYRQIQSFQRMIDGREWFDRFDERGDWDPAPKPEPDRKKRGGGIDRWIRDHLPKNAAPEETKAVSETFFNVAGMLRDGSLEGWDDSCSETIAQLQPKVSRKVWLPFMNGLVKQVGDEAKGSSEILADFYETAAKAVSAPVRSEEDDADLEV